MICQWCRNNMSARLGKRYCSTRCRVQAARYKAAWAKYEQAAKYLDREYNKRLAQKRLIEDAT